MLKTLLSEFFGDLRTQKTRAFLTMFAVCWGTMSVVLLLAFGEGLKRSLVASSMGSGQEMLRIWGGETSRPFNGLPRGRRIRLSEDDLAPIRAITGVDAVSPSYGRSIRISSDQLHTRTYMEGVYPAFEELRTMYPAAGGRFLNAVDEAEKRRVAFLGDSIAARLFPDGGAVGGIVRIDDTPFTVVGVMQPKAQSSMNNGPDADRVIIPSSVFQTAYGVRNVSHLLVRPRDGAMVEPVRDAIYEALGRRHAFDPADRRALSIWDTFEELRMTRLITGGIQIFLGVVGALTLLVAGIGVANVMYVVVRERTREIGVRRALGARKRHIVGQFVFEAVLIAMLGGAVGLAVASGIVLAVDAIPDNGNMALQFLANPKISWPIGFGTVLTLGIIGMGAGLFPARRAAMLDPVEALRYE